LNQEVRWLLDELCTEFGFCLPADERSTLENAPPRDVDAFTDAVFAAEGMDASLNKRLRQSVRHKIEQRVGHLLGALPGRVGPSSAKTRQTTSWSAGRPEPFIGVSSTTRGQRRRASFCKYLYQQMSASGRCGLSEPHRPNLTALVLIRFGCSSWRAYRRSGLSSGSTGGKRRPEPHGHGSFRPSFSTSSVSMPTTRLPRLTRDSLEGTPGGACWSAQKDASAS
jgi:hypothetical protein